MPSIDESKWDDFPKSIVPIFCSLISSALPFKVNSQTQERKLERRSLFAKAVDVVTRRTKARRGSDDPASEETSSGFVGTIAPLNCGLRFEHIRMNRE